MTKNTAKKFRVSGRIIAEYRAKKPGLTQSQIAKVLKINRVTYAGWENSVTVLVTEDQFNTLIKELEIPENVVTSVERHPETGADKDEMIYRKIVEGNTEYLLIPRSVLQDKYRIVALEQIDRDTKTLEAFIEANRLLMDKLSGLSVEPSQM